MTSPMTLFKLTQKVDHYVIFASLKSESTDKYNTRLAPFDNQVYQALALRTHVESLGKPRDVNKRSQSLA